MVALNVIGLNCGTSIDGIDVAFCRISSISGTSNVRIELLSYTEIPVDTNLRSQILGLCRPGAPTTLHEICDLNFALGKQFAQAVARSGIDLDEVDLIASHGQTLWHVPVGDRKSTLQMAEPAVIAQETKRTVVSGFRVAEIAAGRQGAPLAGFFEGCLMADERLTRISQNIGGIGNATFIPALNSIGPRNISSSYLAFDTGPGNVLIDATVRILSGGKLHYDEDGVAGTRGSADIDHAIIEEYLTNEPYFSRPPPKTTGRELFSDDVAKDLVSRLQRKGVSPDAIVATMTRLTAESIVRAYEKHLIPLLGDDGKIDEIYICGGGACNPNILQHLQHRFPDSSVQKLDEAPTKLDSRAKEAVLFALLGYLAVYGRTVPIAGLSETNEPAILGVITPGSNYQQVMANVARDEQFTDPKVLGKILM